MEVRALNEADAEVYRPVRLRALREHPEAFARSSSSPPATVRWPAPAASIGRRCATESPASPRAPATRSAWSSTTRN